MELFIEKNSAYLANAPRLGHTPCFEECWGWFGNLECLKELKILIDVFFFLKQPKKYKPNAHSPKALFWEFPSFFFFFLKDLERIDYLFIYFFWNMKICSLSKSEEDEDKDGVKVMKIYSWWFFFCWKTYPLNENNFGWKLMWIAG